MKTLRYGIAIGLVAGLGACSNFNTMGHSNAAPAAQPVATTTPAVAPDMVRQVQSKLRDDGYYKQGSIDGVWGSGTEAAVRSFQKDHNLTTNGQLDVPTLQALNVASTQAANTNAAPAQAAPPPTQPMAASNPNAPPPNSAPADNTNAPAAH